MTTPKTRANQYNLTGKRISIAFGQGIAGDPHFVYNGQAYDEVDIAETAAGKLVSAVVGLAYDAYTTHLCLLLPPVNLDAPGDEKPVETIAIFATHKTSIGGPDLVEGQLTDYQVEHLTGVASYVRT